MPLADLLVRDEVVIAFFSAVVIGQSTAIAILWHELRKHCRHKSHRTEEDEAKKESVSSKQ